MVIPLFFLGYPWKFHLPFNSPLEFLHAIYLITLATQAIIEQNHKSYHDITITEIRQNLINISHSIKSIKFVYCPAHKGLVENETADKLAKIAAKKAQTLEPTYIILSSEIKHENKWLSENTKEDGTTQKIINIRTVACITSQAYLQKGSFQNYQTEVRTLYAKKSQKQNWFGNDTRLW